MSIHNIQSIALYETKTLLRSWFFRIFAIIAIVLLSFFSFGVSAVKLHGPWDFKSVSSLLPYANLLILNIVQAVIAIFLASDFLKRDKKLDTTEVIYMRAMTNTEYVLGKTIGNLGVFVVLNLIVLFIAMIFNIIAHGFNIIYISYLYYFLIISVPTLIFIMGLAFLIMGIIRNQAICFVLLLAYVAATLFYIHDKFYYLFDYMAFNLPLAFSRTTGFPNIDQIVTHRGIYFFLGLAFICFTIVLLKRLPQSKTGKPVLLFCGTLFLAIGIYLGTKHVSSFNKNVALREQMLELNNKYADFIKPRINNYDIKVNHLGNTIECSAILSVSTSQLPENTPLVFNLNPGLKLTSVEINGEKAQYTRKIHLIEINNAKRSKELNVTFRYTGNINDAACYLDVTEEDRAAPNQHMMYKVQKKYSFVTPKYVLLTAENNWYPTPGAGYNTKNQSWMNKSFYNFQLDIQTSPGLTAISQGKKSGEKGQFSFINEQPLPQISLAIGNYKIYKTTIDSLEMRMYSLKGNEYFEEYFEDIKDTVPTVTYERIKDYQRKTGLDYPFNRIAFTEVPIHFTTFKRKHTLALEMVQPEMIFVPEKGLYIGAANFYNEKLRFDKYRSEEAKNMTEKERKVEIYNGFLDFFMRNSGRPDFSRSKGQLIIKEQPNPYYCFPLFYNYTYSVESQKWPLFNVILESYMSQPEENSRNNFLRNLMGISENEKANIVLQEKAFSDLFNDSEYNQVIDNVIQLKSEVLLSLIKQKTGSVNFDDFLFSFLKKNKSHVVPFDTLSNELKKQFEINIEEYMEDWQNSKNLPAYLFSSVQAERVLDGNQEKTMVKFKVSNTENTEGIIMVTIRMERDRSGGRGRLRRNINQDDDVEKWVYLEAQQTKEVTFLIDGRPENVRFNTLTAKNIPSEINVRVSIEDNEKKISATEGEVILDKPVFQIQENEIIVDNEDTGFSVIQPKESFIQKIIGGDFKSAEKYSGFQTFRLPSKWTLTTNTDFYGDYIRSAYYTSSGEGDKKAIWKIPISENAYYDVFVYIYNEQRGRRRGQGRGRQKMNGEYMYAVHHDDGVEETGIKLSESEKGWNYLGAYYFSPDTATIELSAKSEAPYVIADAVKLVKK